MSRSHTNIGSWKKEFRLFLKEKMEKINMYEKYLKIYFSNPEFDKVAPNIHELERVFHDEIMNYIEKKERIQNGNRKQY
jgi:hypothetical protein